MYGILAIHEVYIQLDCVGMRRVWHLAIPKLLQNVLQELFVY